MYLKKLSSIALILFLSACSESSQNSNLASKNDKSAPAVQLEDVVEVADVVLSQDQAFDDFKERFLNRNWMLFPSHAVYQGYYKHDDQLLVPNGELRVLRRTFFVNELQAIKAFDANQLNSGNASDLAIIEGHLRASLWYLDSFRSFEWNPALYNPAGSFGVILNTDYKPYSERIRVISRRLENVPAYYSAAMNNIKTPTLEHLSLAIQQSEGALKMFTTIIPSSLAEKEKGGFTFEQGRPAELDKRLAEASQSVQAYIDWLKSKQAELMASGDAKDFRIGEAMYAKKFAFDIESSYSAEELYQLALTAKDKLHIEMISITQELWSTYFPETDLPESNLVAVKRLIDKLSEKHVARDQFVDEIRRQMPIIQTFMDDKKLLDSDPSRPLVVRLTPEYQRGFAGASVNAPGPYDATANTYYNVSPLDAFSDEQAESYLREYNHWILQILNIHEAIPGHYTQLMHANKSPSKIKSIFGNGAMVEGWAVYSERMMLENGYGDNEPEMWLMYSKWNLRVVVNTILDYSIQVLGMEREAALDLLMNEAFQERAEAEGKWRRATVSQVQLTSYFTGYSEIYAFREELKTMMGDTFDLRAFHNKFLSYGNAPVPVIKKLMMAELISRLEQGIIDVPSLDSQLDPIQ